MCLLQAIREGQLKTGTYMQNRIVLDFPDFTINPYIATACRFFNEFQARIITLEGETHSMPRELKTFVDKLTATLLCKDDKAALLWASLTKQHYPMWTN